MSPIRPDLPAAVAPVSPPATVRAAQAAFFRAALDQASAAPQRPATPQTAAPQTTEAEARLPRPGALLDIRV